MQSPQMDHPRISSELRNILLVEEAASESLIQAQYLKGAASATLDLIAAAKVRSHTPMFAMGLQISYSRGDI